MVCGTGQYAKYLIVQIIARTMVHVIRTHTNVFALRVGQDLTAVKPIALASQIALDVVSAVPTLILQFVHVQLQAGSDWIVTNLV